MVFGGNTTDKATTEADAAYKQSVHDFYSAFEKIQTTISGLTATNTQLQQQLQHAQMMCQAMTNCTPPPTYKMPFQAQQQMQSQHQNWKNNNGGGQENGRGNNRAKRKGNRNSGNRGNDGNSWNPGNANSKSGGGQQQQPWRHHLTTGKFIDPKNIKAFKNDKYCWTHGVSTANDHTNRTCNIQHASGMHNANATRQNMMGGNPKGNHMIKLRDAGQPEAPPRQKTQIANNIWNLQTQQQPVQHQLQKGYNMMKQPMMQQQMMQP